jgi:hypothetical protein
MESLPSPPRPRPRMWLHAALGVATLFTLAYSGWRWESEGAEPGWDLFRPDLRRGLPYALWMLLILGAHEMGHYLACVHYKVPATLPFLLPGPPPFGTFGAVIRIRGWIPHRRALFDIAVAGPLCGFAVALPVLIAGVLQAEPWTGPIPADGIAFGSSLLVHGLHEALVPRRAAPPGTG